MDRRGTRRGLAALFLALAAGLAGCAGSTSTWRWGNYDDALHAHYRRPQDRATYVAALKEIILAAPREGKTVPPGIYAEYGYALLEEGNGAEAVGWFERERDTWPESRVFMEKMIVNARRTVPASQTPPAGPASALEKGRS